MVVKRGSSRILVFMLVLVSLLSISVFAETGKECSVSPYSSCTVGGSSVSLYKQGFGAVEICEICYKCGVSDGVCPEDYSDGVFEDNTLKTRVPMRIHRFSFYGDSFAVAFQTGEKACDEIKGDCSYVQRSTDGVSWTNLAASECTRNVSSESSDNNAYFRAVCVNVPRKAGCEYCPDPDCTTALKGWAYDADSKEAVSDVVISVHSENNPPDLNVLPNGVSTGLTYSMNAVTGEVNISCSKDGFKTFSEIVYLHSGKNIFDCKMKKDSASCTSSCYAEDSHGDAICRAYCNGVNECVMSAQAQTLCAGRVFGSAITLSSVVVTSPVNGCNYENITTLTCCTGTIESELKDIYGEGGCSGCKYDDPNCLPIDSSTNPTSVWGASADIKNIITRNYRKEINGLPVTLKIIVYNK